MNGKSLLVSLVGFSLVTGCLDEAPAAEETAAELGVGSVDAIGVFAERHVLDDDRWPMHPMQDASYVYYMRFGVDDEQNSPQTVSVMRVRRTTAVVEKIATIVGYPNVAALGGNFIYFADFDGVYKLPKTGGQVQVVSRISGTNTIAADASGVYVAAYALENEKTFHRISKVATDSTTPVELARGAYVTSMALDGTHLYWLEETLPNPANGCGRNSGLARKVSKTGGAALTVKAGINCPFSLAVDATNIYFTNWGVTGTTTPVSKLPKTGGFAQVLGSAGGATIVVDSSYVYWTSASNDLMRLAKPFGMARPIAHDVRGVVPGAEPTGVYFWRQEDEPLLYSLYSIGQ